ncbi:MAG: exodeoxyribonuclease VII small subunit [Anaerolineae bacterium]
MIERREAESLNFEDAYRTLQDVVERLEKGSLPLDESVSLFAYGTELVRQCTALIDQAEVKVRALSQEFPAAAAGGLRDFGSDEGTSLFSRDGSGDGD